jgi:uncharacterized membrane protein
MKFALVFVATLVAFLALDGVWLILVANAFFKSQLGSLLRAQPDLAVAGVFYVIYAAGLVALAVWPSVKEQSAAGAVWRGAALGLTAYATFDLTNLAILERWTLAVALVDMAWGTAASAMASLAGYHAARFLP